MSLLNSGTLKWGPDACKYHWVCFWDVPMSLKPLSSWSIVNASSSQNQGPDTNSGYGKGDPKIGIVIIQLEMTKKISQYYYHEPLFSAFARFLGIPPVGWSVVAMMVQDMQDSYFWMIATMALPPPDPEFVLRGTAAPVHTLHFSCRSQEPEFPILFSGSANGLVQIWNLKTHRVDKTLDGHGGKSVYWVETIRGRDELLSQGRDQKICLWDLAEGRSMVTDSVSMDSVGFCRCSLLKMAQDRWLIAMPADDPDEVQVLELPSKTSVCTLKPEAGAKLGMPMCLKLWQPGFGACPFLMAGYEDGSVILWNLSMGKMLSRLACHQEPVMSLDFDSEKAKGVSGSSEKVLSVWSLDEQQNLKVHKTHELINSGISDVTIRQDRKILATAGWDYRIRIFGWKKMKPLAVLDFHTATVHCVSFSDHSRPSERLLAAGSKDHRISIWSLYNQT